MELWIRSQDKEKLVKIDELYMNLPENFGMGGHGIYSSNTNYFRKEQPLLLGLYKTKKRALEVLDEIQNILKPQMVLSKLGNPIAETCDGLVYTEPNEYEIKELSTYVYEMPKE